MKLLAITLCLLAIPAHADDTAAMIARAKAALTQLKAPAPKAVPTDAEIHSALTELLAATQALQQQIELNPPTYTLPAPKPTQPAVQALGRYQPVTSRSWNWNGSTAHSLAGWKSHLRASHGWIDQRYPGAIDRLATAQEGYALHNDAHNGRVNDAWLKAASGQASAMPTQPSGRWAYQCRNGRCGWYWIAN